MRFSSSRLKLWMNCPLAAHYRYDQNLPGRQNAAASFGTVFHDAARVYFTSMGNLDLAKKTFLRNWADPARLGVAPDIWPRGTSFAQYRQRGVDSLKAMHESFKWNTFHLIGCEIPFLVPFGDHELTGYIDLLGTQRSGTGQEVLKVIDFKTNSREPSRAELALDVQFTVYVLATSVQEFWTGMPHEPEFPGIENGEWLWHTLADLPRRAIWYQVATHREIDAGPRTDTDFGRLYRVCDEIQRAVDQQVFVPKISDSCTYCDFQGPCVMDIPVSLNALADKNDPNRWA